MSNRQKELIINEVKYWEGSIFENNTYQSYQYASKVRDNSYLLIELLNDVGYFPRLLIRESKKENWSTSYVVTWNELSEGQAKYNAFEEGKGQSIRRSKYEEYSVEDEDVFCLSTETKNFIIMTDEGTVELTGNSEAGCWLFRTFMAEHPEIFTDELKKTLYQAGRDTYALESSFIDKAFELGEVEGLNPNDLKEFIKNRINVKLGDLGLKPNYEDVNQEALKRMEWFDFLTVGVAHVDFFASRVTDYSKGVQSKDEWDEI